MTLTIPIPEWSPETWAWVGAGLYFGLCYLVIGPLLIRYHYNHTGLPEDMVGGVWVFSPLTVWVLLPIFLADRSKRPGKLLKRFLTGHWQKES